MDEEVRHRSLSNGAGALSGVLLEGRYRLKELLGRGGMGEVYRAEQVLAGRDVALKVLRRERIADERAAGRFVQEIRALAALRSPHTMTLYDVGRLGEGQIFFTMELLQGVTLAELLEVEGPVEWPRARSWARQILGSLKEAHGQGILHRDLKPANVFVTSGEDGSEQLVVLDFGLARATADPSVMTKDGDFIGTPQYMSPEQVKGDPPGPQSDLYALGVLLFEALSGAPPFSDETPMRTALRHLNEPVPCLPDDVDVPSAARRVLSRSLAKDPRDRFRSAEDFLASLDANETTETILLPSARGRHPRRAPVLALWAGLAGLLLLLGVGAAVLWTRSAQGPGEVKEVLKAERGELVNPESPVSPQGDRLPAEERDREATQGGPAIVEPALPDPVDEVLDPMLALDAVGALPVPRVSIPTQGPPLPIPPVKAARGSKGPVAPATAQAPSPEAAPGASGYRMEFVAPHALDEPREGTADQEEGVRMDLRSMDPGV